MRMILNMRMIRIGDEMMNMRMVLYNSAREDALVKYGGEVW